jgi:putative ABC transport system ATP-binding protein
MNIIKGTNIHKKFVDSEIETIVLRGVNIAVQAGEFVVIMGKSGAGKSTLLYQLSALDRPTSGEILIDNADILSLTDADIARFRLYTLGYIFQDYALIPDLTAVENVLVPLLMRGIDWDTAHATAVESLDSVGLPGKYTNLPSQLSGGEQQRVAVARAVAGKPKIIFADEPTANLDTTSSKQIIELISCLNSATGQTIVMVTHEREYALGANRILHMEDGVIVEEEILRPL